MAVPTGRSSTTPIPVSARRATGSMRGSVASLADAAVFGVLGTAVVAVPITFSISNEDVFAMPKSILAVGIAGLLAVLLGVRWIASGLPVARLRHSWPAVALVGFVGWNVLAWAFAVDRELAMVGWPRQYQGIGTLLAYAVVLIAAWTSVSGSHRRTLLLVAVAIGATVVATYAVLQRLRLDPIWDGYLPDGRVFSTIGQSNALAAVLVLTVPLAFALAAGRSLAWQVAMAGFAVLQLAALVFTLSRGGFLGAGVAAAVLLAVLAPRWRQVASRRGVVLASIIGVALVAVVVSVPEARRAAVQAVQRAAATADFDEGSIESHLDQWAVGVAIAADHPIVGTGQETYAIVFDDYREAVLPAERAEAWRNRQPESPHNHYLAIAAGAGAPALLSYLALIGLVVGRVVAAVRRSARPLTWIAGGAMLAAIGGHLVTDAFMTAETTGSLLFWALLGAGAALHRDVTAGTA